MVKSNRDYLDVRRSLRSSPIRDRKGLHEYLSARLEKIKKRRLRVGRSVGRKNHVEGVILGIRIALAALESWPSQGREPVPGTEFGRRLKVACKARGMTLRQLGSEVGYKDNGRMYQLIRTERPALEVVEKLASALGIDRSELDPDLTPATRDAGHN